MNLWMYCGRLLRVLSILAVTTQMCVAGSTTLSAAAERQERITLAALPGSNSVPAPEFTLNDLNGGTVKLSVFKGQKPVLLYFWATWCPYCLTAKPQIARLREKIPASELEILGINVGEGDSPEKVKRYLAGHPAPYPILYDDGGKVSRSYRVQGIPLYVLIDKAGNFAYRGNTLPNDPMEYLK
ncbi:MAG: peroxiredoxin family protein [Syntrophobacteraceae bacterium]